MNSKSIPLSSSTLAARRGLRLPKRFTPAVFAFYMAGIMSMLMCLVIVGVNSGLGEGYAARVLSTYALAFPVAFVCVMLVRPLVLKLVARSCQA